MMAENCTAGRAQYRIYHFINGSTGFSPVNMENVLNESRDRARDLAQQRMYSRGRGGGVSFHKNKNREVMYYVTNKKKKY